MKHGEHGYLRVILITLAILAAYMMASWLDQDADDQQTVIGETQ